MQKSTRKYSNGLDWSSEAADLTERRNFKIGFYVKFGFNKLSDYSNAELPLPTYSQAPVDSYLAFLEEITEYEEKSIEEISAQAATINDEEIALPSYLSSPDKSDHENDLSEEPSIIT